MTKKFKFKIGQTVHSPFGVVKIIHRWHTKKEPLYDVKYMKEKDDIVRTQTWTFGESEMDQFTNGGVAYFDDDDATEIIQIKKIKGEYFVIFSVWIETKLEGKTYAIEKKYKEKLVKKRMAKSQSISLK